MKKVTLTLFTLFLILLFNFSYSQTQRNPLLEYCTGTWCQWCPCGHQVINESILPSIPNTVVIGYHGPANTSSDPYSFFSGNSIISALGFSGYPTGIIDRTSAPISRSAWYSAVSNRNALPATVDISINKTYDTVAHQLNATIFVTPLTNLTGQFKVNLVLLEDNLIYSQTGNSSCTGGGSYVHKHVVRAMINSYLGDELNTGGGNWNAGQTISKLFSYNVSTQFVESNCKLAAFVYMVGSTLNTSEVQQAKTWNLVGTIVPVEMVTFFGNVDKEGIILNWKTATELNNYGFEIERSLNGKDFSSIGFVKGNGTSTISKDYSFKDKLSYSSKTTLYYRLKQMDLDGKFSYSDMITVLFDMPKEFSLGQNYPNPFNPVTTINYAVAAEGLVKISVYNMLGQEVILLVNEIKQPGTYELNFDASSLPSGTYTYKLSAQNFIASKKLMVIK